MGKSTNPEVKFNGDYQSMEKEIKERTDNLLYWMSGSIRYYAKSLKLLAENCEDKELFHSYVSKRMFDDIKTLAAIANVSIVNDDENENQDEDENAPAKRKKEEELDIENLANFYQTYIAQILVANEKVFTRIYNIIAVVKAIEGTGDRFGKEVKEIILHQTCTAQSFPLEKQASYLLCLVMAVKTLGFDDMGKYSDEIKELVAKYSATVCGIISKEYDNSKKYSSIWS